MATSTYLPRGTSGYASRCQTRTEFEASEAPRTSVVPTQCPPKIKDHGVRATGDSSSATEAAPSTSTSRPRLVQVPAPHDRGWYYAGVSTHRARTRGLPLALPHDTGSLSPWPEQAGWAGSWPARADRGLGGWVHHRPIDQPAQARSWVAILRPPTLTVMTVTQTEAAHERVRPSHQAGAPRVSLEPTWTRQGQPLCCGCLSQLTWHVREPH